jgi:hypothetical protein
LSAPGSFDDGAIEKDGVDRAGRKSVPQRTIELKTQSSPGSWRLFFGSVPRTVFQERLMRASRRDRIRTQRLGRALWDVETKGKRARLFLNGFEKRADTLQFQS